MCLRSFARSHSSGRHHDRYHHSRRADQYQIHRADQYPGYSSDAAAYPITGFTWVLVYQNQADRGKAQTLASASTNEKALRGSTGGNVEAAKRVGQAIAERALAAGINSVVFDRGGYLYHGRVRALTDAARKGGLNKDEVSETEAADTEVTSSKKDKVNEASAKPKRTKEKVTKENSAKEEQ